MMFLIDCRIKGIKEGKDNILIKCFDLKADIKAIKETI